MPTRRTSEKENDDDNNKGEDCAAAAATATTAATTTAATIAGHHASSTASNASDQAVAAVAASRRISLRLGRVTAAAASRMPSLHRTTIIYSLVLLSGRGCTGDFSKKKTFSNTFFLSANL